MAGPVDLDAEIRPAEVDLEAVEVRVDDRFGEPRAADELEEAVLELAARAGAAGGVHVEGSSEDLEVSVLRARHRFEREPEVEAALEGGLVDHVGELLGE